MKWKNIVRNYFTFNRRERRGLLFLSGLFLLLFGVQLYLKSEEQPPLAFSISPLPEVEESPRDLIHSSSASFTPSSGKEAEQPSYASIEWENFDPNQVTSDALLGFGLKKEIVERWMNYRNKGGRFYNPVDISRIYGIDSNWVELALEHAYISETNDFESGTTSSRETLENSSDKRSDKRRRVPAVKLDLNLVDTNALKAIPGIGSYYANAIVSYRDRLGGYLSLEQLLEIYNMRDHVMDALSERSVIARDDVTLIDLNDCSIEELGKHPYISWKQAKAVVNYRNHHGNYSKTKEILETDMIADSVYLKIAPYLSVQ